MKRNKKGFSLVELVVVLVIMSILAALCAPNISAYVQAAKIQNYQTALNQLVDEVQTGLPKTRYWNWQEVQTRAEELLRSDSSRTVTNVSDEDNTKVYRISGASNDANVVYQLTLTYSNNSNTSQKVEISASCEGYSAVTAEKSCDVVLKTNYTDASAYPVIKKTITTTETNGWKQLDERVKTYDDWGKWLNENNNKQNDFRNDASFPEHYKGNNTLVINTTDYVCNSVKFIQFQMPFYCFFAKKWYTPEGGTYGENLYGAYAFPNVDVNDGAGTGEQYDASKLNSNRENVYVYIGDDSDLDSLKYVGSGDNTDEAELASHGWVRHDVIFSTYDGTFRSYADPYSDGAKAVASFKKKYDTTIQGTTPETASNDTNVIYRVFLKNPAFNVESSRGWIVITGSNSLDVNRVVYMDSNQISIYVDNGVVPEDCSTLLYKQQTDSFYKQAEDGSKLYRQTLYFNITKCGYAVGDELVITLNNVHAKELLNLYQGTEATWAFYLVSNVSESANETGSVQSIPYTYKEVDENSVQITIPLTWNTYPFLRLSFAGALSNVGADVSISLNRKSTTTTETDETQYTPILTINGDNNYANITLDWSKCDYITASNIGNMHLLFNKDLSYQVYDKDYNPVGYNSIYGSNTFYLNQMVNYQQIVADGVVHLYCTGVNARDITYEILDAPAPPAAPAVTTTTPAVTTTLPPATAEPETTTTTVTIPTTTTTSATTSTTTTVTTTTATTTTTTTTATTTTTTTVTTTTTTSTTSTSLSTSTTTTASTASATSTTLTTSTTTSSTETTVTTSTSSSGEGAQTTIVTDVAFERAIEIPRHRCVEQIIIQIQDSAAGTSAGSWGYAFTDEYGWNYQGQGAFETNDLTDGTFTIDCSNGAPKKYLKIWKNSDSELVSVTFVYKDVKFLDDELYIHYLQGDSGFNVLRITGNVESGIPNWGNNAAYQADTDFNLYKFEQSNHSVSIYPKNSNYQDLTVENLQNALNDKMLPSVAGGDWGNQNNENYHYEITYAQVTGGLHEIWIYNGIAYTANPLDLSNGSRLVKRYVRGQTIGDLLQLVRREKELQETATTTTVTTTEPAASTTTTTTTTEPAPIAASENGLNVGLDAESAAVCDIQFDTPLFDQTGACRFVITPKDGYTLTNAYAVRVGTVTLSKKSNYTVQTQQWFFWKSKGMTNYTIHVSGVVADSAG